MKLLAAVLLFPILSFSQKRDNFWLKQAAGGLTMAAAGWLSATNEVATHDYRRFAARHPNANPQWANPKLSFRNKYADWPQDKSAAYWGSKTVLVWTTDRHHLYNTTRNFLVAGNIGISMTLYEKPNWKQVVLQAAVSWACFAIGSGAAHQYYKPIN
jgi:hypothetical protein